MQLPNAKDLFLRITQTLEQAATSNPEAFPILLGAVVLCGVVYGFFGYRIYRWVLACLGACAGAALALQVLSLFTFKDVNMTYIRMSFAGILGLVGAVVAPKLFRLFTFVVGGSAIALALHPLVPIIPEPYSWLALVVGFAAGGFLAFVLMRPTLITATAVAGTYICSVALFTAAVHFSLLPKDFQFMLFEIVWGILAIAGILVQFQQKTPQHLDVQGQPSP